MLLSGGRWCNRINAVGNLTDCTLKCQMSGNSLHHDDECVCQQAAMKAVVATSRMHEGSRRRTDSCEIPGSGASRQSSMQQDQPPDSTSPAPTEDKTPPRDEQLPRKDESKSADQSAPSPAPPRSPKPPSSDVTPTGPTPARPPLRTEGLRQASVVPKTMPVQPRLPQKSYSVVEPASRAEATSKLDVPPSPSSLSNGFMAGEESANKTAHCQ